MPIKNWAVIIKHFLYILRKDLMNFNNLKFHLHKTTYTTQFTQKTLHTLQNL